MINIKILIFLLFHLFIDVFKGYRIIYRVIQTFDTVLILLFHFNKKKTTNIFSFYLKFYKKNIKNILKTM